MVFKVKRTELGNKRHVTILLGNQNRSEQACFVFMCAGKFCRSQLSHMQAMEYRHLCFASPNPELCRERRATCHNHGRF